MKPMHIIYLLFEFLLAPLYLILKVTKNSPIL